MQPRPNRSAHASALLAAMLLLRAEGAATTATRGAAELNGQAWARALALEPASAVARGSFPLEGPPFSFVYGARDSAALLGEWRRMPVEDRAGTTAADARHSAVALADPATGLQVTTEIASFDDFPAVEWILRFRNTGSADTRILERVFPLDATIAAPSGESGPPILHYAKGALCSIDDFAPVEQPLEPGAIVTLQPGGGRSSSDVLPFFNLQLGSSGIVFGIGWTGEWRASFRCREDGAVEIKAGMALTHLRLHPGEAIRTPRILALFWEGNRRDGNNLLRQFLLRHHRPRPGGRPLTLPVLMGSWGGTAAADHLKSIHRIIEHRLPIELYWIDAEWFGKAPWWQSPGDWQVRSDLYPEGFKPIAQALHDSGRKLLLWFEPQRVCAGTPWSQFQARPGWLLELGDGTPEYKQRDMNWGVPHEDARWVQWESRRSQITEGDRLWNMGQPEARAFLTDFLASKIEEFGLDWYREDFNIAPLEYWQYADAPDRQGITEIRYVEGLYTMWDELLSRHSHMAIDNCASGGRRIDLETIGRSTALWRTDWPADAIHKQCHTFGLLEWVPLHMSGGAVLRKGNEYEIRSAMTAGLNVELPPETDPDSMNEARKLIEQYLDIQRFFYGDYFPLTPYSQAPDACLAYQLALDGEGIVVALKRPQSPTRGLTLRLRALDPERGYAVTDLDTNERAILSGRGLADSGLAAKLDAAPDSALFHYAPAADTAGP